MELSTFVLPVIVVFASAVCGNLSKVTREGTTDNLVRPSPEKTSFHHSGTQNGSWPNWNNVRQTEAGMNKDQIYQSTGRPHFREGLYGVREWDYLFNYRKDGELKTCQYKILFGKNQNMQPFCWSPEGCGPKKPEPVREVIVREVALTPAARTRQ